jgi:hypothetical protein
VVNLRYYHVTCQVRDLQTTGTATLGVIAATRDEAISKARSHARATSANRRRITKVVSARLSETFRKKEAHS